ncbi:MAG TPA: hypothetical protein VM580_24785, partial [Labilithrix sp.]|nr:hypothetical protein [Labilithrix sp.]
ATLGVERIWPRDAFGADVRAGYANIQVPAPTPSQELVTLTAGPRWRHDWTESLSSNVSAGATVVLDAKGNGDPLLAPSGRASLLYTWDVTNFSLDYTVGVFPSPLTGQVIRSDQVSLRAFTPLSQRHQIFLGASIGYLRGKIVDLANSANELKFDAVLSDVDVSWQASRHVGLFARYQFIAQLGDVNTIGVNPSFLLDSFIVGVQFSSTPVGGDLIPTRFPQRVDGGDTRISDSDGTTRSTLGGAPGRWVTTTPARPAQPAQ